jgi:hypothetical protein
MSCPSVGRGAKCKFYLTFSLIFPTGDIVVSVDYSLVCSSRNGVYPVLSGSFNVYG